MSDQGVRGQSVRAALKELVEVVGDLPARSVPVDLQVAFSRAKQALSGRPEDLCVEPWNLITHLERQRAFSERTFGPGPRASGVVDHIRKELLEIEADPGDLEEWVDVVLLALDGAWRSGATSTEIVAAINAKMTKNEARDWPDWRTADPNKAIEHKRS